MSVGRQSIGLYSGGSARGFSPVQAGNLRIDGLYFDQAPGQPFAGLPTNLVRSAAVHVGIAAQGYLFPAPTGVVDYQLRVPGDEAVLSTLNGYGTYGVYYNETDLALPVIRGQLNVGGGIDYTHNEAYDFAASGDQWNGGVLAHWQPTDSLAITPFWGVSHHIEYGEKPYVFIGDSGIPRFRSVDLEPQRGIGWSYLSQIFGATARMSLGDGWLLAGGIVRSISSQPEVIYYPILTGVGASNTGEYSILAYPPESNVSTSGEMRLTRLFGSQALRNTVYLRITGRRSSSESGGGDFADIGPGTTTYSPQAQPSFNLTPTTEVQSRQWTPGLAYRGVWRERVQLTAGMQKVFYHRLVLQPPPRPDIAYTTSPWLFSAAASGSISSNLLAYGSYARGFENIGAAPVNASNANEPVPSQLTRQVDAGIRYQLLPRLQLVAGVFEIDKPYFNLDQSNLFRLLGTTRNRGAEFSVTGDLTSRLNVVSGIVLIQPRVQYTAATVPGPRNVVAVGPIPGYMRTYLQYHPERVPGLILGATLQITSSRYAVYPDVSLPADASVGADVRYQTKLLGHTASLWLQAYNLTNSQSLLASSSGQVQPLDARRFDLSLAVDF